MPVQSHSSNAATRQRRWAWVVPVAVLVTLSGVSPVLHELSLPVSAVAGAEFYVGLLAGSAWQLLSPRDFFDRFRVWAALFAVAGLLAFLPGARLDTSGIWAPPSAPLGVVVGVVVADAWMRRRTDRL